MEPNVWIELLKYHGIPTFLLLAIVYFVVKYWMPFKRDELEAAKVAETLRQENQAKHNADLVAEIKQARAESRAEREKLHEDQREAEERQHKVFKEMVDTIREGLDANTHELRRNSALTVASAEILGARKKAVEDRAGELAPEARKS